MSAIRRYAIEDCVAFRKTTEEFGGLSNMAPGYHLSINGVIIPSAEHLYQACRFPLYSDLQLTIIKEASPMRAKWISRANIQSTRPDWEQVRYRVMQWVVEVKLCQNWNKFSSLLLSTKNMPIVEYSPKDKVWGAVRDGNFYTGINALGRILMHVREEFVNGENKNECLAPLDIPDFLFLDNKIGVVCYNEFDVEHNCSKKTYKFQ